MFLLVINLVVLVTLFSSLIKADIPLVDTAGNTVTNEDCQPDITQTLDISGVDLPESFTKCTKEIENLKNKTHPDVGLDTQRVIERHGYPAENYSVTTDDGYILTIHRIPRKDKPAVYLQHGLAACSDNWLMLGETGLAFFLWRAGFDVWLGNFRGTTYSQGHVSKKWNDPNDFSYWDFSWHELGVYDVPANIRKIKEVTNDAVLFYVGHSMGTTAMMVSISQRPDYINKNVAKIVLLATCGFISRSPTLGRIMGVFAQDKTRKYLEPVFKGRLENPKQYVALLNSTTVANFCTPTATRCGVCSYAIFAMFGFDAPQVNYTNIPYMADKFPNTVSVKSIFHYGQSMQSCNFCQYDYGKEKNQDTYGQEKPPCYSLGKANVPVYAFYGDMDNLNVPKDTARTLAMLPKGILKENNRVDWPYFNHVDFVIAKGAIKLIYEHVEEIFKGSA